MRMIDADALIKSMKSHTVEDNGLTDDYKAGLTDSIRTAVALAENASTIDAVPVVRGEWIQKHHRISLNNMTLTGTYPTCNLCNYAWLGMAGSAKYCPSCGRRLEGEHVK